MLDTIDITQGQELTAQFAEIRPDYVVHCAARTDLAGERIEDYLANTDGVENVVAAVKNCSSVEKIVFFLNACLSIRLQVLSRVLS